MLLARGVNRATKGTFTLVPCTLENMFLTLKIKNQDRDFNGVVGNVVRTYMSATPHGVHFTSDLFPAIATRPRHMYPLHCQELSGALT